jgi:hypothetical protein
MGGKECSDGMRNFILQRENVLDPAIVTISPTVRTGLRIDELSRNAHTLTRPAETAFEEIMHAELARDLTHIGALTLVLE